MKYDLIAIGIIAVCVGIIIGVMWKKFPIIAAINIKAMEKNKQDKIKKGLIEDRLKRKLAVFNIQKIFHSSSVNGNGDGKKVSWFSQFYQSLKNLEQRYKEKVREIEPQTDNEVGKGINILLQNAKELTDEEKYKEAEAKYIEAISLDNKCTQAYNGLAELYSKQKDFTHAKEIYQYLLKLNSSDDVAYQSLGMIASREGNFQEAKKIYLKSISLNNKVAGYHIDLGEVYIATGAKSKALGCFLEAIKLEPNNPRNLDLIIDTALKLKDKKLALEYFGKLNDVNPGNEKLKEFQKKINSLPA